MTTVGTENLSHETEQLVQQIVGQLEDLKEHGHGRMEIIVRGGQVTTLHSQKTWVRKGERRLS